MGDFDAECHFKPKERQRLKGEKSFSVSHVDHEQQAMIGKAGVCREQGLGFFWKEGLEGKEEKNIRKTQLNWVLSTNS